MHRATTLRLVLVLALAVVVTPLSASAGIARCAAENVESYEVRAEARRTSYGIGDTAVVDLHVTDSLTGAPAADIDVGIGVEGRGERLMMDSATTGPDGDAVLRVHLRQRHAEPGRARALAAAWESIDTSVYCTGRYGYRSYEKLFRIRS